MIARLKFPVYTVLALLFSTSIVFSQSNDSTYINRKLFDKNTSPVTFDVSTGLGFTGLGIATQYSFGLDIYHFYFLLQTTGKSGLSDQGVKERSYLIGYRLRDSKNILSFAAGIGETRFKCTSGENFDCYTYVEGTYDSYPIIIEYDWIIKKWLAFGTTLNVSLCKRADVVGILGVIKIGMFK